jgi:hypothetical protein
MSRTSGAPPWDPQAYPDQQRIRRRLIGVAIVVVIVGAGALILADLARDDTPTVRPSPSPTSVASLGSPAGRIPAGSVSTFIAARGGERVHG